MSDWRMTPEEREAERGQSLVDEITRLRTELAAAREDTARVDALQSMLRAVDFDFEDTGESVLMFTLPANVRVGMNLRATVDAARSAAGEEG